MSEPGFPLVELGSPMVVDPGPDRVVAVPSEADGADAVVGILFCECHGGRVPPDVRVGQCLLNGWEMVEVLWLMEPSEHVLEPGVGGVGQYGDFACESECCEAEHEHRVQPSPPAALPRALLAARIKSVGERVRSGVWVGGGVVGVRPFACPGMCPRLCRECWFGQLGAGCAR